MTQVLQRLLLDIHLARTTRRIYSFGCTHSYQKPFSTRDLIFGITKSTCVRLHFKMFCPQSKDKNIVPTKTGVFILIEQPFQFQSSQSRKECSNFLPYSTRSRSIFFVVESFTARDR